MTPAQQGDVLLRVRDVRTYFRDRQGVVARLTRRRIGQVQAVDGVSFDVVRGETLGLVGESGSGKSTLARDDPRPDRRPPSGSVTLDGREVLTLRRRRVAAVRRRMQMIFQDPHSSLSPRFRVSFLLNEPYVVHHVPPEERSTVDELLEMVGLSDEQADKYPHELSGGQARRVSIARALALHPDLLLADEPTAGLDVSAAASILNLMKDLARRLGLTYVLITHDLNVVGYCADRIAVMYVGQLVELGPAELILGRPKHPYTHALLSCAPVPDPHLQPGPSRQRAGGRDPESARSAVGLPVPSPLRLRRQRCVPTRCPSSRTSAAARLVACHHWRRIEFDAAAAAVRPQAEGGPA